MAVGVIGSSVGRIQHSNLPLKSQWRDRPIVDDIKKWLTLDKSFPKSLSQL